MKSISQQLSLLILTLLLASCGAKNSGSSPINYSFHNSPVPKSGIKVSDRDDQIEISSNTSTTALVQESSITLPIGIGAVMIQMISPDEVTETIVNQNPENPYAEPTVVVEIIVSQQMPVVVALELSFELKSEQMINNQGYGREIDEISIPIGEIVETTSAYDTHNDLEVFDEEIHAPIIIATVIQIESPAPEKTYLEVVDVKLIEKGTQIIEDLRDDIDKEILNNETVLANLKAKLNKRITILEHRIGIYEKEHKKIMIKHNNDILYKWKLELQELQALLNEAERL